jgi:hypothetical protein
MGGGRIIPRSLKTTGNKKCFQKTTRNKKCFQPRPKKFDSLTVAGMALCADLGPKCQNLFCLV